jgi:hypothetical protein
VSDLVASLSSPSAVSTWFIALLPFVLATCAVTGSVAGLALPRSGPRQRNRDSAGSQWRARGLRATAVIALRVVSEASIVLLSKHATLSGPGDVIAW